MARNTKPREVTKLDAFIGQRIRQARMEQGISQETLGVTLGVSFQQVQKYEKGKNRVSSARLEQIAAALDRPRAYFFENADEAKGGMSKEMSRFLTLKAGVRIARAFPKLTPTSQALIVSLVGQLADRKGAAA